jgi:hypothetical protein
MTFLNIALAFSTRFIAKSLLIILIWFLFVMILVGTQLLFPSLSILEGMSQEEIQMTYIIPLGFFAIFFSRLLFKRYLLSNKINALFSLSTESKT